VLGRVVETCADSSSFSSDRPDRWVIVQLNLLGPILHVTRAVGNEVRGAGPRWQIAVARGMADKRRDGTDPVAGNTAVAGALFGAGRSAGAASPERDDCEAGGRGGPRQGLISCVWNVLDVHAGLRKERQGATLNMVLCVIITSVNWCDRERTDTWRPGCWKGKMGRGAARDMSLFSSNWASGVVVGVMSGTAHASSSSRSPSASPSLDQDSPSSPSYQMPHSGAAAVIITARRRHSRTPQDPNTAQRKFSIPDAAAQARRGSAGSIVRVTDENAAMDVDGANPFAVPRQAASARRTPLSADNSILVNNSDDSIDSSQCVYYISKYLLLLCTSLTSAFPLSASRAVRPASTIPRPVARLFLL